MTEPFSTLKAVPETLDEDVCSAAPGYDPVSPISRRSSAVSLSPVKKDFSASAFFGRSSHGAYQKMDDENEQEMMPLGATPEQNAMQVIPPSPLHIPPLSHSTLPEGAGNGSSNGSREGYGSRGQGLGISGVPKRKPVSLSRNTSSLSQRSAVSTMDSERDVLGPMLGIFSSDSEYGSRNPALGNGASGTHSPYRDATSNGNSPPSSIPQDSKFLQTPTTTYTSAQQTLQPGHLDPRGDFDDEEDFDDEVFYKGFGQPPAYCSSRSDIHESRTNWLSLTVFVLAVYSTIMSGIWLVTAILQPRWGHGISSRVGLNPSTATTISALISKTIEMSFVTVFVSCLGQILTRRSFVRKTVGMTLGEMTMRNWVFQPGSLITHAETIPSAGLTVLGALALTATIAATLYTTASDAMVAPKLKFGKWEHKEMAGHIRASYANAQWVKDTCPSVIEDEDELHAAESCMNIQFSGQSYRNLLNWMQVWNSINDNGTDSLVKLSQRPPGSTLLFDNTTMAGTWIETENSDVEANFKKYHRIINNATLAMPHPGVYAAATDDRNGILQPKDLAGVGEYSVRAGVVSPAVGVMCVNMAHKELEPLIYTEWPHAKKERTGVGKQTIGKDGWEEGIPRYNLDLEKDKEFLNRTVVDDIFRWGPKYGRRPPVFQLYPADYNVVTNSTVYASDSIYVMGKTLNANNYTMCELRSWLSLNCSTLFDVSGKQGAKMTAHCEDPDDKDSYLHSYDKPPAWGSPVMDWKWLADAWRTSMDLNGGAYNNNASNARLLTQLALTNPELNPILPSMAEALAVYASSTLILGSKDSPFVHYWDNEKTILGSPGPLQAFNASVRTQEYTSGHVSQWQAIFYIILVLVFAINLFCLIYFIRRSGLVTDFTEPQNLFALAINSPPSAQLKGSCGAGPVKRDLVVPWRVAYAPSVNHYFFEEANARPWKGKYATEAVSTARDYGSASRSSYKRLSNSQGWI